MNSSQYTGSRAISQPRPRKNCRRKVPCDKNLRFHLSSPSKAIPAGRGEADLSLRSNEFRRKIVQKTEPSRDGLARLAGAAADQGGVLSARCAVPPGTREDSPRGAGRIPWRFPCRRLRSRAEAITVSTSTIAQPWYPGWPVRRSPRAHRGGALLRRSTHRARLNAGWPEGYRRYRLRRFSPTPRRILAPFRPLQIFPCGAVHGIVEIGFYDTICRHGNIVPPTFPPPPTLGPSSGCRGNP